MTRVVDPRTPSRRTRTGAGVLALVVAATSVVLAAPLAAADDADHRVDLSTTIAAPTLAAASGQYVVLDVSQTSTPQLQLTTNGKSLATLDNPAATDGSIAAVRDGKLVAYHAASDTVSTDVYVTDLATNTAGDPVNVPSTQLEAADPTTAVYVDADGAYQAENLATATTQKLGYAAPTSGDPTVQVSLTGGANALMAALTFDSKGRAGTGYLDVVPLDGTAGSRLGVAGLSAAALRGDQVIQVRTGTSGSTLCFQPVANWPSTVNCTPIVKATGSADQRDAWSDLIVTDSWVQWTLSSASGSSTYLSVGTDKPGSLTKVTVPGDAELGVIGDPARPLATVGAGSKGYVGEVNSSGTIVPRFSYQDIQVPVALHVLELTPDRVSGLDNRPEVGTDDYQSWQRSVSTTGIGEEDTSLFPRGADLGTSAARTLVDDGSHLKLYDRGALVRTLSRSKYGPLAGLISGPYYPSNTLAYLQALRVDGTALKTGMITGLFGSLVLVRTNAALGRYDVVDLVSGDSTRVEVPVSIRVQGFTLEGLWGDWVYGFTFDDNGIPYTLAVNYRTNTLYQRYGLPVDYGDGFVAVRYAGDSDHDGLEVWNPATGAAEEIPDADWDLVVTDGTSRIAYSTASQLVVRTLSVPTTEAPRLLGVLASDTVNLVTAATRSWTPEFDTTKPLRAGTLTIRDAAGEMVWMQPTPASKDGSLRGITFDASADLAVGDYTWQLVAPAADGSGNVVGIDGSPDFGDAADASDGISGALHVVNKSLGTVKAATPTISGTVKVDQTLTAKPGSWTPATSTFSYQWLRTSTKGVVTRIGTDSATYKVSADDVGQKLSVTVTGSVDGWKATSATSKLTATVAKSSFTTATPTVAGTAKAGSTLTATAHTWKPAPTSLTYAWYRVKGSTSTLAQAARTDATYVVQSKDVGYMLKVKVTGSRAGYNTATRYSAVTKKVVKA